MNPNPLAKPAGTYSQQGDRFISSLWSSLPYKGEQNVRFFAASKDDANTGIGRTNLIKGGNVQTNETLEIVQIGIRTAFIGAEGALISPTAAMLEAAQNLLFRSSLRVKIGGKEDLGEFPLAQFMNLINFSITDAVANVAQSTPVSQLSWIVLPLPIPLDSLTTWSITLETPRVEATLTDKFEIMCIAPLVKTRQS